MTIHTLAVVAIICLLIVMIGLVAFYVFDMDGLSGLLIGIGGASFLAVVLILMIEMICRNSLVHHGPDYKQLDEAIVIISSYNIKDKSNEPSIYTELVNKIEKYNKDLDAIYEDYRFYELEKPEKLNTYNRMYYDYENNVAKWETGGIVTW